MRVRAAYRSVGEDTGATPVGADGADRSHHELPLA
jgi:hypothetical protein